MTSMRVIPSFDVVEDIASSLMVSFVDASIDALALQRREEALAHRVVVAVPDRIVVSSRLNSADRRHGGRPDASAGQRASVKRGSLLRSSLQRSEAHHTCRRNVCGSALFAQATPHPSSGVSTRDACATRSSRWWRHPAHGTSWQQGRRPDERSRTRRLLSVFGLLSKPGRGFCKDLPLLLNLPELSA